MRVERLWKEREDIQLSSSEISREVCREKATPPIARRKNPIEIELSPTEDSGTSSSQAWVPPQPKNRRRIEIVESSTEKCLSTQSLGPSRRSTTIVRRKQPPEPKEATIAPLIAKSWSRNQSCHQDGKDLCTTWPKKKGLPIKRKR